jgi:hypothetical protein
MIARVAINGFGRVEKSRVAAMDHIVFFQIVILLLLIVIVLNNCNS